MTQQPTTLNEWTHLARQQGRAIPHFNISTIDMLHAVVDALTEATKSSGQIIPLCIGCAEGERDWMGESTAVELVRSIAHSTRLPIFVNADHTYSVQRAKSAIDAGYDSVVVDFAEKSYEENVAAIREVVAYRNEKNSSCLIEAELGFIGSGSQIKDAVPEGVSEATMTQPDQAVEFITATGADMLAPSVGNVHGLIKSGKPRLHPTRVADIAGSIPDVPLVLHGGSGSTNEDFLAVIDAGISMIHISSELRNAYKIAIVQSVNASSELAPYKYLKPGYEAVYAVALDRIKLFWKIS